MMGFFLSRRYFQLYNFINNFTQTFFYSRIYHIAKFHINIIFMKFKFGYKLLPLEYKRFSLSHLPCSMSMTSFCVSHDIPSVIYNLLSIVNGYYW